MKLQKLALALITTLGVAGTSQAAIVYGQSDTGSDLILGDAGSTTSGATVAGVFAPPNDGPQPFTHFTAFGKDGNDVYSFISSVAFSSPWIPANHKELGYWGFKDLGLKDVWFGEWAPENRSGSPSLPNGTIDYTKRTVFYIGDNGSLTLPSSGTVNYSVEGINQYNANSTLLTGTLTASFTGSGGTLTGALERYTTNKDTLNFNSVTFNSSGVISGTAAATYLTTVGAGTQTASVSGQFFGNQSVAGAGGLAGIAKVTSNRNYDTAFGGKN